MGYPYPNFCLCAFFGALVYPADVNLPKSLEPRLVFWDMITAPSVFLYICIYIYM